MIRATRTPVLLILGLAVALLAACARPASPPPPDPQPGERETYTIGVSDLLRVVVWKNQELTIEVPVRNDGMISVPLIDDVQAEGMTPEELKEVIAQSLSEFITAPDVTVIVMEPNSQTVTVIGAVLRSAQVPLTRGMRVLEAIAQVGGFNTWANKNNVRIHRKLPEGPVEYRFNYGAFAAGKAPGTNIVLQPGDTIVVPD